MSKIRTDGFLQELNSEYRATRACIERIPESLFEFKPHPKSMQLGYLTLLVAEVPLWIRRIVVESEIDFANFKHESPKTTDEMVNFFERNMEAARAALQGTNDEELTSTNFSLKANGNVLYTAPKIVDVSTTLNHWVHHRGQLTVYMRLNDIAVPSIYGPSADEQTFAPPK
jgi:uncharacterized damage-inducible protein DinB